MRLELRALKPNPLRDFTVDPIDAANVEELRKSIKEDGFWGGVVVRKYNGHYEIAAGHHRVDAALKAGLREADIFVLDREHDDDSDMVRIYARENATQRGNTSTAATGSIAAAIRLITRAVFTGSETDPKVWRTAADLETLRGNISSARGLGEPVIAAFLDGLPGCSLNTVRTQLASLKSSGDYARIVGEVKDQIETENREAVRELERIQRERARADAEKARADEARRAANQRAREATEAQARVRAREAAATAEANARLATQRRAEIERESVALRATAGGRAVETARSAATSSAAREITFDFAGVARYLTNDNQLRVFRDVVTGQGIAPYLPVNKQAALAKKLVELAREQRDGLSGAFIRENVANMVLRVRTQERALSREEQQALRHRDYLSKVKQAQEDFARNVRGMMSAGGELQALLRRQPEGVPFPISGEFRNALGTAKRLIDALNERI